MLTDHQELSPRYPADTRVAAGVGTYTHAGAASMLDGRSKQARYLHSARARLTKNLPAPLSAAQEVLVDRVAMTQFRLNQLDEKSLVGGIFSESDARQYASLSETLGRLLECLGFAARPRVPDECEVA